MVCPLTQACLFLSVPPSLPHSGVPPPLPQACLCLGVWNAPHGHASEGGVNHWDARLVAATGYDLRRLVDCHHAHLGFVRDMPLKCRALGSGVRAKSLHCTIIFP